MMRARKARIEKLAVLFGLAAGCALGALWYYAPPGSFSPDRILASVGRLWQVHDRLGVHMAFASLRPWTELCNACTPARLSKMPHVVGFGLLMGLLLGVRPLAAFLGGGRTC